MLLFMDGMAHYDSTRIGHKYTQVEHTRTTWSIAAEGRYGNCIKRVATDTGPFEYGYLDIAPLTSRTGVFSPVTGGVCGFAIKIDDLSLQTPDENGPQSSGSIFAVLDGNNWPLKVLLNTSGTFTLVQAWGPLDNYGAVIASSAEGLTAGVWYYLEFKWVIGVSGSFEIRVNTVPVLTYSGDTTSHNPLWTAGGVWNGVRLFHFNTGAGLSSFFTLRMCDLYLADLAYSDEDDVHDFLGDGVIETILPDGVGSSTGWTPDSGANWDRVNDTPQPDDDSSYVATTDPDTKDTYTFQDIPSSAIVKGIHVNILARKEEEGSSTLAPIVRQGGTDYEGPVQGVANVTYDRYITQAWDLNPATLAKFTAAEINSGIFGVKKVL
jgi:hypothetical protein